MIGSFRNAALQRFWMRGEIETIPTELALTVEQVLHALDAAVKPQDMFIAGLRRYVLEEKDRERYGVVVAIGWVLSYDWIDAYAVEIDLQRVI
jgi:plasmid maintenance system killer protein